MWIVYRPIRICFCCESARSWSQFRINFSQNTAWDLSSEHWWDLRNFESISISSSLIGHLSKIVKYLVCPSKCGELTSLSRRLYFFLFQGKLYILFSIPFMIFWNSINLAYASQLGNEDFVSDYIFTSQRESHSVPDINFLLTFNYFVTIGVIENRFTKINFKNFNGNCEYSSCFAWWILFLNAPLYKGLAFEKIIFKTVNISLIFFSNSLKITCILLRQVISPKKSVVLSVKFTILISWSPICMPLFLLSALMRLVQYCITAWGSW